MMKFLGVLAADGYGEAAGISCEDSISGKLTCNLGVVFMKEGKLRVYEVAEAVGYKDITYFSGTFKKLTGMSPTEYQNASF